MNLQMPFISERRFVLVSHAHGYGLLLLRSTKRDKSSTRIDILFKDVRAMEIRRWFDGIRIEDADKQYLADNKSCPIEMMEHGNLVYALKSGNWTGFIVGGIVSCHEDDKMYGERTALLKDQSKAP